MGSGQERELGRTCGEGNSTPLNLDPQAMANLFVRVEMPFARGLSVGIGLYIFGTDSVFLQPYDGGQ